MKLFVFGNPEIEEDNLAINVAKKLKHKFNNIEFVFCENLTDIFNIEEEELIILDVAKGIQEPTVFNNLKNIQTNNLNSLHDFDIAYFLKLMKSIDKLKRVKILALPMDYNQEKAREWVKEQLFQQ